jgi:RsiW-degrading membrane proteinase PrsW (M82 family)
MGLILSILFGFGPMLFYAWVLYWLDRFEKEPKVLFGFVFTWGALVSATLAFLVNTVVGMGVYYVTGSETATDIVTGSLVAPLVEETLKGLAVLLVFFIFRQEFDSTLDGIVYAGITALGFAASENAYYIYNYGYLNGGYEGLIELVFVRTVLVGWQHPFYTAFIGIGLAMARFRRGFGRQMLFLVLGWGFAVTTHAAHNTIASLVYGPGGIVFGTLLDWSGWFFMFLFILWVIHREKQGIKKYLREEVVLGILTTQQYQTACSAWAQNQARVMALFSGKYRVTQRFYALTAELAYKKEQFDRMGEERGNTRIISELRGNIKRLSLETRSADIERG